MTIRGEETPNGGTDRLGNPGEMPEGRRRRGRILHHGRADAARRGEGHRSRHPHDRLPPRAGRRVRRAGLQPAAPETRRVHGGLGPGGDQPVDGASQRPHRLLPGHRHGRRQPDQPVRPSGLPGNRPDGDPQRLRQIRRPHPQREAHPAADQFRLPEGDDRQAGPGLSRLAGRHPLPEGRGDRRSTGAMPDGRSSARGPMPSRRRSTPWSTRSPAPKSRSSRRAAASSGRAPGTR